MESPDQARHLRLLQCDVMQGYLVSKPLPADEMTRFLTSYSPTQIAVESELFPVAAGG